MSTNMHGRLSLWTILLLLPAILAAPAPLYKPTPPIPLSSRIVGTWKMDWGGIKGEATFYPNGIIFEGPEYSKYCGYYCVDGNILTINEHSIESDTYTMHTYTFTMETTVGKCKTLAGVNTNGTRLTLEKP